MARRITIDLTDAAEVEIDRLCGEFKMSTADLFRHAMSILRMAPQSVNELRAFAVAHHGDQPSHVLLHSLTVDLPAMCDKAEAALGGSE